MMPSWKVTSALSVMALAGCTNLQAVNTTAGQLVAATSSWNSVADEFEASCVRRNQVSESGPTDNCSNEKQATATLEAADKILSAYFTALQQASDTKGSSFSVDSGVSALSSSVKPIPGVNPSQLSAMSGLATFLADTATKALQERTIDVLISDGAPKAEAVIDVLSGVVTSQLQRVFDREKSQTLSTFSSYIQQSGSVGNLQNVDCTSGISSHDFAIGSAYLLAEAYCSRVAVLATKSAALDNYKKSLATAKTALMDLQTNKDDLGAKDIAQQLISQVSSLQDDIEKINKAF